MNITDMAAIVTGGATGLGAATAELLSATGAKVTILGRRADLVAEKAAEIDALGVPCDVTDETATQTAFATANNAHGPVRILINCAALTRAYPLLSPAGEPASLQDMAETISVNVLGTLNTVRLAAAEMAKANPVNSEGTRGVIINVSSLNADHCLIPGAAPYVASKGAINSLTHVLANELGPHGIRVVTIAAAAFETENLRANMPAAGQANLNKRMVFPQTPRRAGGICQARPARVRKRIYQRHGSQDYRRHATGLTRNPLERQRNLPVDIGWITIIVCIGCIFGKFTFEQVRDTSLDADVAWQ